MDINPPSTEQTERRSEQRLQAHLYIQLAVEEGPSELCLHPYSARASDISREGLQIEMTTAIPASCQVEMLVNEAHHHDALLLRGVVRWCRPIAPGRYRLGIWLDQGLADLTRWQSRFKPSPGR